MSSAFNEDQRLIKPLTTTNCYGTDRSALQTRGDQRKHSRASLVTVNRVITSAKVHRLDRVHCASVPVELIRSVYGRPSAQNVVATIQRPGLFISVKLNDHQLNTHMPTAVYRLN